MPRKTIKELRKESANAATLFYEKYLKENILRVIENHIKIKRIADERDDCLVELSKLYEKHLQYLDSLDNNDFEENPEQMQKFKNLLEFFEDCTSKYDGEIRNIEAVPKHECAGFDVVCRILDFTGDEIEKLSELIKGASAIGIDVYDNEYVSIGFTVPDVFRRKQENSDDKKTDGQS